MKNKIFATRKQVEACLNVAQEVVEEISDGNEVIKKGIAFGDLENDTEIEADKIIGEAIARSLKTEPDIGTILIEGCEPIRISKGNYQWFIDPLDGSLDYLMKGHTIGLPFSTCVTVLENHSESNLKFQDIVVAGIIDLRSGDAWICYQAEDGLFTNINNHPAQTMQNTKLDLGSMIVLGEMYYPENRERLFRAFAGMKGWLRNPGSAAYEMALVASGQAVAYICDRQKIHELGAGYALVKGAGGVVVDFCGNDISGKKYDFNSQTDVILAANQNIADEIVALLKK